MFDKEEFFNELYVEYLNDRLDYVDLCNKIWDRSLIEYFETMIVTGKH